MLNNWKNIKIGEDEFGRHLETKNISENLTITITMVKGERRKLLKADFMGGRFTINKSYLNTYDGNRQLQEAIDEINSEEKIKKYLGI